MTKAYTAITANNNGLPFPYTQAIDASGPLATDGTEYIKEVVDDIWLREQALLDFYDYPPNGQNDSSIVNVLTGLPRAQSLAAQYMNFATPGTIVNWPSAIDPFTIGVTHGIDIRLLLLNGQGIDRTEFEYRMLDSIVYIGDSDNAAADSFYHADDAAGTIRNTAGDWLILPDLRGYSFRGLDEGRGVDPDGAGRIVGSNQDDAFQNIIGLFETRAVQAGRSVVENGIGVFTIQYNQGLFILQDILIGVPTSFIDQVIFNASDSLGARTSSETRNKNIATRYAIHY